MTTTSRRLPSRRTLVAIIAGVAVLALGALAFPRPPQLSTEVTGDAALASRVKELATATDATRNTLSVALIENGRVTYAGLGADTDTEFEIGSVTKTFTSALLADSIERGEVEADTTLGDLLDLGDSPAAGVTLEQLATHHSGLPRLPLETDVLVQTLLSQYRGTDPYQWDVDQLVAQARAAALTEPAVFDYSNFGVALLGQALAAAAGTDYATLIDTRIVQPLALADTSVPIEAANLAADAPTGFAASGRGSDAWTLKANAPAGGIRSTATDMAAYATALLDGTAPGAEALEPRTDAEGLGQIGLAWFITEPDGEGAGTEITWHNGMTGGFASFVGLDRANDRAVVVLSSTAVEVDQLGFALLEGNDK